MKAWHIIVIAAAALGIFLVMKKKAAAAPAVRPPVNLPPMRPVSDASGTSNYAAPVPTPQPPPPPAPSHSPYLPPAPPAPPATANTPQPFDPNLHLSTFKAAVAPLGVLATMPGFDWLNTFKVDT